MADQTRTIEIVVETKDAVKDIDKLNESLEETTESTEEATKETKKYDKQLEDTSKVTGAFTNQLDKMTGGLFSSVKGILSTVKGLKSLKVALIATGLGAIVVIVGTLATAFSRLEGPMRTITEITGGLGSVLNVVLDRIGLLGSALINLLQGNTADALENWKEAWTGISESMEEAYNLGVLIARQTRENSVNESARNVVIAQNQRLIEKELLLSRDISRSVKERQANIEAANKLQLENLALQKQSSDEALIIARNTFNDSSKNSADVIAFNQAKEKFQLDQLAREKVLRDLENRRVDLYRQELQLNKQTTIELQKQEAILEDAIEPSLEDLNAEYDRLLNKQGEFGKQAEKAANDIVLTYDEAGKAANDAEDDQTSLNQALGVTSQAAQGVLDIFSGKTTGKDIFKFFLTTLGSILSLTTGGASGGIFGVIGGLFADGGLLRGPSHDQGGIWVNAEGGEGIINKRSMSVPWIRDLASELNQIGGGVKFADGGIVPTPTGQEAQLREIQSTLQQQQIVLYKEDVDTVNNLVNNVEFRASL